LCFHKSIGHGFEAEFEVAVFGHAKAVLFVTVDHRSGRDGIFGGKRDLTLDPALVILFASEFQILGSKGTPCSAAIDVWPFVISAIAFLPINPGFNFFKFPL